MKAVTCACGTKYPRHPALEVECPQCHARAGVGCIRPSGHRGNAIQPHAERRQLAFTLYPCACLDQWERATIGTLTLSPAR
jgi:hypothetical protein